MKSIYSLLSKITVMICIIIITSGCSENTNSIKTNYSKIATQREKEELNLKNEILLYVEKEKENFVQNIKITNFMDNENGIFASLSYNDNDKKYMAILFATKTNTFNIKKFKESILDNNDIDIIVLNGKLENPERPYTFIAGTINNKQIKNIKIITNKSEENMIMLDASNPTFILPFIGQKILN